MLSPAANPNPLPAHAMAWLEAGPPRPRRMRGPRFRRARGIAAQLVAWPLLVKAGLLTGFALSASVQHLLAG